MNQILISKRIYVTKEMKRKKAMYKIIYILSILVIIALLVYYVYAERNRDEQESIGKDILSQIADDTTVEEKVIVIALDDDNEDEIVPLDEETEQEVAATSSSGGQAVKNKVKASNGASYDTEAVLSYPKLGINYPVLSDESDALLKVSLCKYWGPTPNTVGNYCIVGHNYRSGKMFGKLGMAQNGDQVILKDLTGNSVTYVVYSIYRVQPTDVSCTSQLTNGKREITLITCANFGKERLVVKAKEI